MAFEILGLVTFIWRTLTAIALAKHGPYHYVVGRLTPARQVRPPSSWSSFTQSCSFSEASTSKIARNGSRRCRRYSTSEITMTSLFVKRCFDYTARKSCDNSDQRGQRDVSQRVAFLDANRPSTMPKNDANTNFSHRK
jgi:hypothetical protein